MPVSGVCPRMSPRGSVEQSHVSNTFREGISFAVLWSGVHLIVCKPAMVGDIEDKPSATTGWQCVQPAGCASMVGHVSSQGGPVCCSPPCFWLWLYFGRVTDSAVIWESRRVPATSASALRRRLLGSARRGWGVLGRLRPTPCLGGAGVPPGCLGPLGVGVAGGPCCAVRSVRVRVCVVGWWGWISPPFLACHFKHF